MLLGPLPVFTPDFLGRSVDGSFDTGSLYRCLNCALRFRYPQPTPEQLLAYYAGLSEGDWWQHGATREVWVHIKAEAATLPQASVLDVGCFRGDLLSYLGESFERFGIEPSASASAEARTRGIKIIGDNIESLRDEQRTFGAITLIDVIEHLPRPMESLSLLTSRLAPGGKLMVFTGDTGALSWRIANLHYWYSALPEHVAFFRRSWFSWAAPQLHCELSSYRRLPYEAASLKVRLDESSKNVAFAFYHQLEKMPGARSIVTRLPLFSRVGQWQSCWWTSARDHLLVTLTKR